MRERPAVVEKLEDSAEVAQQRVVKLSDGDVLVGVVSRRELGGGLDEDVRPVLHAMRERRDPRHEERLVAREVVAGPLRPPPLLPLVAVFLDREWSFRH
jgi:hypothetical protein